MKKHIIIGYEKQLHLPYRIDKKTVIPIGCFACYGHAVDARHSDLSRLTAKETKALMDAFSNSK